MVIPTSSGRHKALEVPPHRFQKHQFNLISNLADLLEIKEYHNSHLHIINLPEYTLSAVAAAAWILDK